MKNKYYGPIVTAVVVMAFIGGYFYLSNDNDYYNSYRLQGNCTNNALDLSMTAMAPMIPAMMGLSDVSTNSTNGSVNETALNEAVNNATLALNYQQKMLKSAKTDTEKNYAKTLIEQSNALLSYLGIVKTMGTNKNSANNTEFMNQLESFSNQTQNYQNELQTIVNGDTTFKNRLKKEDQKNDN